MQESDSQFLPTISSELSCSERSDGFYKLRRRLSQEPLCPFVPRVKILLVSGYQNRFYSWLLTAQNAAPIIWDQVSNRFLNLTPGL